MRATLLILAIVLTFTALAAESSLTTEQFSSALEMLKSEGPLKSRAFGAARLACELSTAQRENAKNALLEILQKRQETKNQTELESECLKTLTYHLAGADVYQKLQERLAQSKSKRVEELVEVLNVLSTFGVRAKGMYTAITPLVEHMFRDVRAQAFRTLWALNPREAAEYFKLKHLEGYCFNPNAIDKEVVQIALNHLQSTKPAERSEAIAVLSYIRNAPELDPAFAQAVDPALTHPMESVRLAALQFVPRVGWTPAEQLERLAAALKDKPLIEPALKQLAALGEPARKLEKEILQQIGSDRRDTSIAALQATAALKLDALRAEAAVTAALQDQYRTEAAQMVLEMMGERGAVWRKNRNALPLTVAIVHAAGKNGNQETLFRALDSSDNLDTPALGYLNKMPPEKLETSHFIELIAHGKNYPVVEFAKLARKNPEVARRLGTPLSEAIHASQLDYWADKRLASPLNRNLELARWLGVYAAPAAGAITDVLMDEGKDADARRALKEIGPAAIPPIMDLLESADPKKSNAGVEALSSLREGARPALPRLLKWMEKDPRANCDQAVRMILLMKLEAGDAEPIKPLLGSTNEDLKSAASRIMERVPMPQP